MRAVTDLLRQADYCAKGRKNKIVEERDAKLAIAQIRLVLAVQCNRLYNILPKSRCCWWLN